jgi:hypothetical protein
LNITEKKLVTGTADLFDPATVQAVADRFTRVLTAVAAAPAARPRQVQVLDGAHGRPLARLEPDVPESRPGFA